VQVPALERYGPAADAERPATAFPGAVAEPATPSRPERGCRLSNHDSTFKYVGTDAGDVSEECDEEAVLELLEDDYARGILTETSAEPMSVKTLSERCEASEATIYRRIDRLKDCDLVEEQIRPRSDGNHYKVYRSRLETFAVSFEDGELRADITRTETEEDVADRFTRMWEDL
jgi:DNA-binding HxlR family transcriptional regulator